MSQSGSEKQKRARFEKIVGVFTPDLFRYAYWLSRDRAHAEDVVQESLLRAWRAFDRLNDEGSAKQWLLTIVRRENARVFERKRLQTVDIDQVDHSADDGLSVSANTDVDDMRQALTTLEDDYREPLVLQVLMGYSTEEIAQIMEIKPGAVLTRLFRARKKLRAAMESHDTGVPSEEIKQS